MTYNRKDLAVQVNIKTTKGYTMSEIGALDDRIKRLEYYTVLNALELDTKTTSVRDATGNLERFKNGIFADPLNDHSLGRTEDREYKIAISSVNSLARPTFNELFFDFKLQPTVSTQYKSTGRYLTIDYDSEELGGNPFATNYRNCTESYYMWRGFIQLFPSYDANRDITQGAPQNITVDLAGAFERFLATGIAQEIDNVSVAPAIRTGQSATQNFFSQTTTTTISDIAVNSLAVTNSLGNVVQDVSVLPYIAPRMVAIVAKGLKPNTRIYPYFDGQAVSTYCQPAKVNPVFATAEGYVDYTKISTLNNGKENTVLVPNGALGAAIKTDDKGNAYVLFSIPGQTFRTGDRTFILTNVDSINATNAITTTAEGVYTASSIAVTQSEKSFTVNNPYFVPFTFDEVFTRTWAEDRPPPRGGGCDPVAQTFSINDTATVDVPGIYLTEIGVFFKSKSDTLGATLVVCQTTAGVPNSGKVLCVSNLRSDEITVSDDATAETRFKFQHPVLVQSDELYAFYVVPDGSNPDYEIWMSEVGGTDITTSRAITQQPYAGIMYVSSDGRSWTPIQSTDLKFSLYRAKFKYSSATIVFSNDTDDYLTVNAISRKTSGSAIQVGDVVYTANASNLSQTLVSNSTVTYPYGVVQYIDELNGNIYLDQSNGKFSNTVNPDLRIYRVSDRANTSLIVEGNRIANATIVTINNPIYHGIVPRFSIMEPAGTSVQLNYLGTSNSTSSFAKDSISTTLTNGTLYEYGDYERVVRSYSNEIAAGSYGINGTSTFVVTLSTTNQYVSPVIDLSTKTFNIIQNLINFNANNEFSRYGSALNKYISKTVFLTQEAEDLLVYITAHRPPGTDMYVYAKFLNSATDPAQFDDKDWTLLSYLADGSYIYTSTDNSDFREYKFGVPVSATRPTTPSANSAYLDSTSYTTSGGITPSNVLTYYDGNGALYRGFNNFALKVALFSSNPVSIPTVRDIRAVALQV